MSDVVKLMEERDIKVAMRDGTKLSGRRASIASLAAGNTGSGLGLRPIQPITIGGAG
jgi:hypothetical protein